MLENLELYINRAREYIQVSISVSDGVVSAYVTGDIYPDGDNYRSLSKEGSEKWLCELENIHIEKWKSLYINELEDDDGESWLIKYKREGKRCRHIIAENEYPRNWDLFIELLDELVPLINPARLEKIELRYMHRVSKTKNSFDYTETLIADRKEGMLSYNQSGFDVSVTKEYRKRSEISKLINSCEMYLELFNRQAGIYTAENKTSLELKLTYHKRTAETIKRSYNRYGLPDDWNLFLGGFYRFISYYGLIGEIFDPGIFARGVKENEYIFYSVEFEDDIKTYYYRSENDTLKIGDKVLVPTGSGSTPGVAEITDFEYFTAEKTPVPLERAKMIIRKIGKDEKIRFRCPLCNRDIDINECLEVSESARSICISDSLPEWAATELTKKRDTCLACCNMPSDGKI